MSRLSSTVHGVLDHDEIVRLYGPWRARTPQDAAELFEGYGGRWWIAGGWAIEAFTNVPGRHDDLDPSIPRSDVAALHQHLAGRLDVWQADDGTLRPMVNHEDPLSTTCGNLWLRPSGAVVERARAHVLRALRAEGSGHLLGANRGPSTPCPLPTVQG